MNSISPMRARTLVRVKTTIAQRLLARFFEPLLARIDRGLEVGSIEGIVPDGSIRVLGGRAAGPVARVNLNSWRDLFRLGRTGSVGWYEAWAKGEWDSPDPVPLFELFVRNRVGLGSTARPSGLSRLIKLLGHMLRRNSRTGARRNVMAHYDLGNDFYKAWLDPTMSYSSAMFTEPLDGQEALECAQKRKMFALETRLQLKPQSHVLEIGCGWGYFATSCARKGHAVTAITLSPSQKSHAESTAKALTNKPDFQLRDYRDVTGQYDAIVSIEMVEAVGQAYWPAYLDSIDRCLRPGGRAALQFITIADDVFEIYAKSVDFIQAYVFPGGLLISESRFRMLAEIRGLRWDDPQYFGLHYAQTLRHWRIKFDAAVDAGKLPHGFDARFVKLWRYYLMYCEGGFRAGGINVVQVTLVKGDV
jgi:cyclopropane-fatty-acyl-phospholipid synthase